MEDYINKMTLRLQPGLVFGPDNSETACLDRGRSPGEWMLKHGGRVRWGNATEIQQDIDHFETFGKLPERDEARKENAEWRRAHSQPICNPPEAIGEYVDVMGEMTVLFTVQMPVELCHEQIACEDPAIEAALQAVSGHVCTYIWGEDKKPAVVYCDVGEQNVEIESDGRECLEKDSTG